jgi:hypothetical protein
MNERLVVLHSAFLRRRSWLARQLSCKHCIQKAAIDTVNVRCVSVSLIFK